MIVVDESLNDEVIIDVIAAWYAGQVVSVLALRPNSIIKDDAIPMLLLRADQPTFVTVNVNDFWKKVSPHHLYCIICIDLPQERIREALALLQRLLRTPEFKRKSTRMGKVIRLLPTRIEYYQADRHIQAQAWAE